MHGLAVLVLFAQGAPTSQGAAQHPPVAHRVAAADTLHGVVVPDPYRWMEAMTDSATMGWVRGQDKYARARFAAVPARDSVYLWVRRNIAAGRVSPAVKAGDAVFQVETGGHPTPTIVRITSGTRHVVLDSTDAQDGRPLVPVRVSPTGTYLAYAESRQGSSWRVLRVRTTASRDDLVDRLEGIHASNNVQWLPDDSGFFYERYRAPVPGQEQSARLEGERLFFHRLGTPQSADELVYDPGASNRSMRTALSDDGRLLVIHVSTDGAIQNRVVVYDLATRHAAPLLPEPDASYGFLGNHGDTLWFQTNLNAPNSRIIGIDRRRPAPAYWWTVVPERRETVDPWSGARLVANHFIVPYIQDTRTVVTVYHLDGRVAYELALPKVGSIWTGFVGRQSDPHAYYAITEFSNPGSVYRLDVASGRSTLHAPAKTAVDPEQFVTRQVFYTAPDGTRIPMLLAHRRDLDTTRAHPTWMYGYGAFKWAAAPWYRPDVTAWMQLGGVFALPGIRGGGEYGDAWHQAGVRRNKQTAISDYIAAGDWLVAQGVTSSGLLAANGGSASGMLVAAAMIQRPTLFAAVTIDYPALDMVRFDRFTGGVTWRSDFGSTEDADDFRALLAYSPYHTLQPGVCYPPTLVLPGERDETTVPMHAYKFVAALQHASSCPDRAYLRVSWGAGHAAGVGPDDSADNWADQIAFMATQMRLTIGADGKFSPPR